MATTQPYTVTTRHDHPAVQLLAKCIEYLRSVCDGARSHDSRGFSAFDKNLGHGLADKLASHQGWSRQDLTYAVRLAWKYREQLRRAGLSFPLERELRAELEDAPAGQVDVAPTPSTATVRLWMEPDGRLSLAFSHYDHHKLGQLMATVPMEDRWWDEPGGERWLIKPQYEGGLLALYGVELSPTPAGMAAVPPPQAVASRPAPRKAAESEPVEIRDYDATHIAVKCPFPLKDKLKAAVPWKGRRWEGGPQVWIVAAEYREAVEQALGLRGVAA
ncbi:MAG: hypothetical protein HGA45_42600 [Chloroflexales bacterium]|nr:hypothetical protein [Chloroflexales bacterium]